MSLFYRVMGLLVIVVSVFYLFAIAHMLGTLWAFRENTNKFVDAQVKLNNTTVRVLTKLVAATEFNYDFNNSNKKFIQNVAELYVQDEVALLRRIPAKP